MTVVNPKSISGITSITTASGSDNLLTIHTSDASNTERFRIDSTGATKIVTGIVTTLTATTGIVTTLTANTITSVDSTESNSATTGAVKIAGGLGVTKNIYTSGAAYVQGSGGLTVTHDLSIADKIVHTGDTNTAIRFPEADHISLETGGSERLRLNNQYLIKGHTSVYPIAGHYASVQLTGTTYNDATLSLINNANDATGSYIYLSKQRSGSQGGATVVQDDDLVGQIGWTAADGTDLTSRIAEIKGMVDGTPGSNDTPGRLSFWTTADGAQSSTERLRITAEGKQYIIGANSGGFNATTLPNGNTLNINTKTSNDGLSVIRYSGSYAAYGLNIGRSKSDTLGTNTIVANGDDLGHITWYGADGTDFNQAAAISVQVDGSPSDGTDMPGRFVFKTSADGSGTPTERVRITSGGRLMLDYPTATEDLSNSRISAFGNSSTATGAIPISVHCGNVGSGRYMVVFFNGNGHVGSIITSGSSTTYETTSDYRLKENAVAISDAITRLKTLKPYRFNFKADPSTTVDGFFAHEVTAVPEAISGTKDAVVTQAMIDAGDSKEGTLNDPIYQGIDQSKLVPLLTAALQEAVTKIEVLETRLNNAGIAT